MIDLVAVYMVEFDIKLVFDLVVWLADELVVQLMTAWISNLDVE